MTAWSKDELTVYSKAWWWCFIQTSYSQPGFYWGHLCSWTLTLTDSMQHDGPGFESSHRIFNIYLLQAIFYVEKTSNLPKTVRLIITPQVPIWTQFYYENSLLHSFSYILIYCSKIFSQSDCLKVAYIYTDENFLFTWSGPVFRLLSVITSRMLLPAFW